MLYQLSYRDTPDMASGAPRPGGMLTAEKAFVMPLPPRLRIIFRNPGGAA